MSWALEPGRRSGPIALGATRAEVRATLGRPHPAADDDPLQDRFGDVRVRYDNESRVESVEVWAEVEPTLAGRPLSVTPYIDVVATLRALDQLTLVRADGAWALGVGVGAAAQGGVHRPRSPGDSVIVFAPGTYDSLFELDPVPARLAVRDLGYVELETELASQGWTAGIVDRTAPLVPGEPEVVTFRRGRDRLTSTFQPVAELRSVTLEECSAGAAHEVQRSIPHWAAVDAAAVLVEPPGPDEVYWALTLAEVLADIKLTDHVERYVDHPRAVIADAARRALASLG